MQKEEQRHKDGHILKGQKKKAAQNKKPAPRRGKEKEVERTAKGDNRLKRQSRRAKKHIKGRTIHFSLERRQKKGQRW